MNLGSLKVVPVAAVLTLAGCCACSKTKPAAQTTPPAAAATAAPAQNYPVITRIVGRHQTVTISAGPTSALYSVQSPDGKTLVAYATLDQLRQLHPDQFRMIEPLVAADTSIICTAARAD